MFKTLSDLCACNIERTGNYAEIIVDHTADGKPVRLMGFATQADKDDFTVYEEGWHWFQELSKQIHSKSNK